MNAETTLPQQLLAANRVETYLLSRGDTFAVSRCDEDDIYGDPTYQLVWHYSDPEGHVTPIGVLIKGDPFQRGSLWFETSYDVEACPGGSALMESKAVYLFYYFLDTATLYIIPLASFREWVMENIDSFRPEKVVNVKGPEKRISSGRFVPLEYVEKFPRVQKLTI